MLFRLDMNQTLIGPMTSSITSALASHDGIEINIAIEIASFHIKVWMHFHSHFNWGFYFYFFFFVFRSTDETVSSQNGSNAIVATANEDAAVTPTAVSPPPTPASLSPTPASPSSAATTTPSSSPRQSLLNNSNQLNTNNGIDFLISFFVFEEKIGNYIQGRQHFYHLWKLMLIKKIWKFVFFLCLKFGNRLDMAADETSTSSSNDIVQNIMVKSDDTNDGTTSSVVTEASFATPTIRRSERNKRSAENMELIDLNSRFTRSMARALDRSNDYGSGGFFGLCFFFLNVGWFRVDFFLVNLDMRWIDINCIVYYFLSS